MTLINSSKMAALLICAGAIPFILLTALVAYNIEFNYFEPEVALKSYALAIGSFVCGSHWGIYLVRKSPINLLVTSNICTLIFWGVFINLENYELFFSVIFCYFFWLIFSL